MNVWTHKRNYTLVARHEWKQGFDDIVDRNRKMHDDYLDLGIKLGKKTSTDGDTMDYVAERAADHAEADDYNTNRLSIRESVEQGYNLYAIDFSGTPLLLPCTAREFEEVYDKSDNVKLPSYLI